MREIKFKYYCKDMTGKVFSFIATLRDVARCEYINRKDKNKIEIYEGDKWQSPSGKIYIVEMGESRDYESGEVIGNIHDKE